VAEVKGLILAAGRGTRLRPLTDRRSKPMLPLANQPLIAYPLQKLLYDGITEIGIVVGDNEDELTAGLAHVPAELTFIRQPEPLGLAHAVSFARGFTADSDFTLLFCDNLFSEPLALSSAEWNARRLKNPDLAAMIHVIELGDPRACGVAVVDGDGWVTELEEKPAQPRSNLAVIGVDFLRPDIYQAIERIEPSARGELEITDALAELVRMGRRVYARRLSGFWYDTGTFPDLIEALRPVMHEFGAYQLSGRYPQCELSGPVGIGRRSVVENCRLEGPVMIGEDCRISGCTLGPYVTVGDGCTLADCELTDCQVYPGTRLSGMSDHEAIYDGEHRVDRATPPGG
jgi:glucose-1-phosphate thymidylyltransferase